MARKQCRICRKPDNDDLISVQLVQEQVTIAAMILAIAGVSVTSDRRLPQNICLGCLERLKEAFQLRQQCIAADVALRDELTLTSVDYIVEKLDDDATLHSMETDRKPNSIDKNAMVEMFEIAEARSDDERIQYDINEEESATLDQTDGSEQCFDESDHNAVLAPVVWREGVHYDAVEVECSPCCGCTLNFSSAQELKVHSVRFHRKAQYRSKFHPLQCNVCFRTFHSRKILQAHQMEAKVRAKKSSIMFRCLSCSVLRLERRHILDHLEKHHSQLKMDFEGGNHSLAHQGHVEGDVMEEADTETNEGPLSVELQEIKIEIQTHSLNESDDENNHSRVSSTVAEGEATVDEEYYIENDSDDEFSMEDDENAETSDGENEQDLKQPPTTMEDGAQSMVLAGKGQTLRLQRAMCRIVETNLQVIAEEEGYLIVELLQHRCCCCTEFFETPDMLEKHLKRRAKANLRTCGASSPKYTCEYCGMQFMYSVLYVMHKRMREQRQFYMCRLCKRLMESETRMKSHMLHTAEHAAFYKLSREDITDRYESVSLPGKRCCSCWKYFDSHEEMQEHFEATHETELSKKHVQKSKLMYACEVCRRRFGKQEQLEHHTRQATIVLQYFCKLCDFQTRSPRRIELHLYSAIHRNTVPTVSLKPLVKNAPKLGRLRYCCFDKCGAHFREVTDLHKHAGEHHETERKANKAHALTLAEMIEGECFECDVCGQLFKHATALKNHQSMLVQRDCVCSICGIKKRSRALLLAHERTHTGERPYGCDYCDKTFSSTTTRNSHLKCHTPRKYECETCKEMFARLENLKRHVRLRHSEPTHFCEVCPKKFKTRETLAGHMRMHTGEKPYKCRTESCDKWYVNIGDRRRHEMSVHTLERPHKCRYCKAGFIRKRQLTIHERRHTGNKPFVCTACGKGFYEKAPLSKHSCSMKGVVG